MKKTEPQLSLRQQQILAFITASTDRRGYPPSMREIGKAVGLSSTSTVEHHLNSLGKQGFLKRDPARPRTYQVVTGSEPPAPVAPACPALTPAITEETSEKVYVLQVILGPDLGQALLNGALLTVGRSNGGPLVDDATLLGRVVGLTHPL